MKLLLARHGNTFEGSQTPVWVGAKNDLPLVSAGIEQAKALARYLRDSNTSLNAIYCGPLARTSHSANIIVEELGLTLKPIVDHRLTEIDYGKWTGLTNQQIQDSFGPSVIERWETLGEWPKEGLWQPTSEIVQSEIASFTNDLLKHHNEGDTVLTISSNGRLRYFLDLIPGELKKRLAANTAKVKTGALCQLRYEKNAWQLDHWNSLPGSLLATHST